MPQLVITVLNGPRKDKYMDLQHEKVQNLLRIMKRMDWAFVRYVPTFDKIRHNYCILPISIVEDPTVGSVRKLGAYVFNYSVVEKKAMLSKDDFGQVVDSLGKSREPFQGYIGPLATDDLSYRLLMVNDEISVMPEAL